MRALRSLLGGILLLVLVVVGLWLVLPAPVTEPMTQWLRPLIHGETDPLVEAKSTELAVRVLFIGNSLTYYHDMPTMIRDLATAAMQDKPFVPVRETPGGCTLQQHWARGRAIQLLGEAKWEYVVLQEQSQVPSWSAKLRGRDMYPYARQFCTKVREAGAKPVFFLTWGRRDGDPSNFRKDTYPAMQHRLNTGYAEIAKELSAAVVPVGIAWQNALERRPDLDLWEPDGLHPNRKGSYLAACMFYAAFYRSSPLGIPCTCGLDAADARFLQEIASANSSLQ